jgi:flagellar hook-associated protein 1 FlgK
MSGILGILHTAKQAILSEMSAINTTGSNIANANTTSYARLRPVFSTVGSSSSDSPQDQIGVQIADIQRVYDKFLESQIVEQENRIGYTDTRRNALDRIEAAMNQSDGGSINEVLSEFWGAWNDLAANPSGTAERDALVSVSQSLASMISQEADNLIQIGRDMDSTIDDTLTQVNQYSADIANYNRQITQIEMAGGSANNLRDKRSELLQNMANALDIQYYENSQGAYNIMLANGTPLVVDDTSWELSMETDAFNASGYHRIIASSSPQTALDNVITGGKVGALLEMRDTTIDDYLSQLDTIAEGIVNSVNGRHAVGYNAYSDLGGAFFEPFTEAKNMQVSASVLSDPQKIAASATVNGDGNNALLIASIKDGQVYPALLDISVSNADDGTNENPGFTALIDNSDAVTRSTTTGHPITLTRGATAGAWTVTDNGGYTGLAVLSADATTVTLDLGGSGTADITLSLSGDWQQNDSASFKLVQNKSLVTCSGLFDALVAHVGQDVADCARNQEKQTAIANQLNTQKESISGVSIDEEMTNLIKYQFAYNAAGKLANTVNEMLDTMINLGK